MEALRSIHTKAVESGARPPPLETLEAELEKLRTRLVAAAGEPPRFKRRGFKRGRVRLQEEIRNCLTVPACTMQSSHSVGRDVKAARSERPSSGSQPTTVQPTRGRIHSQPAPLLEAEPCAQKPPQYER